jgi:hypothetical protein
MLLIGVVPDGLVTPVLPVPLLPKSSVVVPVPPVVPPPAPPPPAPPPPAPPPPAPPPPAPPPPAPPPPPPCPNAGMQQHASAEVTSTHRTNIPTRVVRLCFMATPLTFCGCSIPFQQRSAGPYTLLQPKPLLRQLSLPIVSSANEKPMRQTLAAYPHRG